MDILYTKEAEADYLDASLISVMQIHLTEPPGRCSIRCALLQPLGTSTDDFMLCKSYHAVIPSCLIDRVLGSY